MEHVGATAADAGRAEITENTARALDLGAVAAEVAQARTTIEDLIKLVRGLPPSRPAALVVTKLEEADLWLGRVAALLGA
jgi:hypothetical protein